MKICLFLANGFEETEAIAPLDLLRRTGADIFTVGIGGKEVVGAHGITLVADLDDGETLPECDAVVLPGGMPGTINLERSETVSKTVDSVAKKGGYLCAICAAPSVLGKKGLLKGKRATCYMGFEETLVGATVTGELVETDGRVITAKGAGAAVEFGLAIVEAIYGKAAADALAAGFIAK